MVEHGHTVAVGNGFHRLHQACKALVDRSADDRLGFLADGGQAERIAVFGADFKHRRQEALHAFQTVDRAHVVVAVGRLESEFAGKFDLGDHFFLDVGFFGVFLKIVAVEVHVAAVIAHPTL